MRFITTIIVLGTILAVIVPRINAVAEPIEFASLKTNDQLGAVSEFNWGKAIQMLEVDKLTETAHTFNIFEIIREISQEAKKYHSNGLHRNNSYNSTIEEDIIQLFLSVSSACQADAAKIFMESYANIHNIPKQELAIWRMLDSWGKIPERVLFGNSMWLGAYEECTEIPEATYCNTEINLKGSPLPIRYGSCVPKRCTSNDMNLVINFLQKLLSRKFPHAIRNTDTVCDDPDPPYSGGAIATIVLLAILGACLIVGTAIDILLKDPEKESSYSVDPPKGEPKGIDIHGPSSATIELKKQEANGIANKSFVQLEEFALADTSITQNPAPTYEELKRPEENEMQPNSLVLVEEPAKADTNIDVEEASDSPRYQDVIETTTPVDAIKSSAASPHSSTVEIPMEAKRETKKKSTIVDVFLCFSIIRNTNAILSTKTRKGNITSINGIRFFSLTWVLLGHYYDVVLASLPNNLLSVTNIVHRFTFLGVVSAYVSVDTFFVLSGLLFSYLTLKKVSKRGMKVGEVLMWYVHRYIRLTPPLAVALLFWTNLFPTIATGPLRSTIGEKMYVFWKPCEDYWWSTLLYINNFYPNDFNKECMNWTWYLANDTQFYILAPGILALMILVQKSLKGKSTAVIFNFLIIAGMCAISMIVTGIITGVYNIPALTGDYILPNNPRAAQVPMIMDRIYVKPYVRIPPYLIGMFLGYIFHKDIKPSKSVVVWGWITAFIGGMIVVYGPWKVFKAHGTFFTDGENIMYAATHRVIWSCAVAWVIYACHYQYGGFVDKLLSWKVFLPLSRLTYNTYLVHLMVMAFFVINRAVPSHYQDSFLVSNVISMTFISYAMAYVLSVLVEFPVVNLEKIIFKR